MLFRILSSEPDLEEKPSTPHPTGRTLNSPLNREEVFYSPRGSHYTTIMGMKYLVVISLLQLTNLAMAETSTEPTSSTTTKLSTSSTEKSTMMTEKSSSTEEMTTGSTTSGSTSTTGTPAPATTTEWQDMDDDESDKLVNFVVGEIQKLKMEHKELDECQELNLSSVLSGKKLSGKITKFSVTLKVQPQVKNTEACAQQNSTTNNMHPEICEADVTEGDHGGTEGKTLLRSTCLQVEELQD